MKGVFDVRTKFDRKRIALIAGTLAVAIGLSAANALSAEQNAVTMTVTAVGKKRHQRTRRYQKRRAVFLE